MLGLSRCTGGTITGEECLVDIELVGFPSQEEADQIGAMVEGCLSAAATELCLDMSGPAGVTVAYDYDRALAELDRGFVSPAALVPSNDNGVGVAMNVPVIREGMVRSHLVLHAGIG
jgi:hypothetical protein